MNISGYSNNQDNKYNEKTLQNIWSSGKNIEAICFALLRERNMISYDDLVVKYWPEFGKFGKEMITIADILRHDSGLPFFANPIESENYKKDTRFTPNDLRNLSVIEDAIEKSIRYGTGRYYHAITRGWILSAILKRVDAKKRTIGQFISDEISKPLSLDVYCAMSPQDQSRCEFADSKDENLYHIFLTKIVANYIGLGDPIFNEAHKIITTRLPLSRRILSKYYFVALHII